jgi:Rrf2 family protein
MASIVRLTEGANLALHAVVLLAQHPLQSVDNKTLARQLGASGAHLSKVMQRLQKAGILTSVRGPKGGFMLARNPDTVTMLDVYEVIEGPYEIRECLLDKEVCGTQGCLFGGLLRKAGEEFRELLTRTRISDLLAKRAQAQAVLRGP